MQPSPQEAPKRPLRGPPEAPKRPPRGPQKAPKRPPQGPQEGPKRPPRGTLDPPRSALDPTERPPRTPGDPPGHPPRTFRDPPGPPEKESLPLFLPSPVPGRGLRHPLASLIAFHKDDLGPKVIGPKCLIASQKRPFRVGLSNMTGVTDVLGCLLGPLTPQARLGSAPHQHVSKDLPDAPPQRGPG